jgi:hypothetical protein
MTFAAGLAAIERSQAVGNSEDAIERFLVYQMSLLVDESVRLAVVAGGSFRRLLGKAEKCKREECDGASDACEIEGALASGPIQLQAGFHQRSLPRNSLSQTTTVRAAPSRCRACGRLYNLAQGEKYCDLRWGKPGIGDDADDCAGRNSGYAAAIPNGVLSR